jgi:GNAT superfamily N-acetyltransferase
MEYRPATREDVPELATLLEAYMDETFNMPWAGSPEALARDAFGDHCRFMLAVSGRLVGFVAYQPMYDLYHCRPGVEVIDLYVVPESRSHAVAIRLLAAIADVTQRNGARFMAGQGVTTGTMPRLLRRFAHGFPGLHCYLSGRGFRAACGARNRDLIRMLPPREWSLEP